MLVTYESGYETSLGQWYVPGTYGAATYEEAYNKSSQGGKGEPTNIRFSCPRTQEVMRTVTSIEVLYEGDDSAVGENGTLLNWNSVSSLPPFSSFKLLQFVRLYHLFAN